MYLQHFGLADRPFRIVPSPRYFYLSETHDEGRARILYGIRENRGFVVVTGGVGLGKTTVLLSVIDELEKEMDVALIVNPIDSIADLLRMICTELGATVTAEDEASLVQQLNDRLLASYAKGRGVVLMLDEAQNLSLDVLEKVRTLSNLQTEETSLLQVVLVGQPELTAKLNDHRIRQLRQRIGVWHEIEPLDRTETDAYIVHRLRLSGANDPDRVIDPEARRGVHESSRGIPRLVNQLCDTALVVAYGAGSPRVTKEHVDEAAHELRLHEETRGSDEAEDAATRGERSGSKSWAWVALLAIVLVVATGFAWKALGPRLVGASADVMPSPTTEDLASSGVDEAVSEADAASPIATGGEVAETAVATDAAEVDETLLERRAERLAEVQRLRATPGLVYAVHLASFRDAERVERFARALLAQHPDWVEPLFVVESDDEQVWYRVLAGGTRSRADALALSRSLKKQFDLDYSQITRLDGRARPLAAATGTDLAVAGGRP